MVAPGNLCSCLEHQFPPPPLIVGLCGGTVDGVQSAQTNVQEVSLSVGEGSAQHSGLYTPGSVACLHLTVVQDTMGGAGKRKISGAPGSGRSRKGGVSAYAVCFWDYRVARE